MTRSRTWSGVALRMGAACVAILSAGTLGGASLELRDGRILEGQFGKLSGMADNPLVPGSGKPDVKTILFVDDDLRRTFVPSGLVAKINDAGKGEVMERIPIRQPVASQGARIARLGPIVETTRFDRNGHRRLTMMTNNGKVDIIQGITLITPNWTKVEAIGGKHPYILDMRIATSSIPRDVLYNILTSHLKTDNLEQRLKLVRLFLQSERYQEAQTELEGVIRDFPDEEADLQKEVKAMRQLHFRRVIDEINMRRKVGQHQLAYNLLDQFPTEDVSGEVLQQVREMMDEYEAAKQQGDQVLALMETHLGDLEQPGQRALCEVARQEIGRELNVNTLDRMADYVRLGNDPKMSAEEKISLAISGWMLGTNEATTNLQVSLSLFEVRNMVLRYLREPGKLKRDQLLKKLRVQEGATPQMMAKLIANMAPPIATTDSSTDRPGFHEMPIQGLDKEPLGYYVQLPPEYDPHRRYPTIVTLNGGNTTPQQQLDWWAGEWNDKNVRQGQATRHGYIVIAVDWTVEGQKDYEYSAREHHAVLSSLRDACRHFSIDTDRVFLSGHSMGGDAAWDIGLAHPDLWAGVIPIVAVSDKYCALYWPNAKYVPFYVVAGELDGDKTVRNSRDLDRYMKGRFDVTVVEYLGRGHESFSDEIQRIFDWMGRKQRNFFLKEFQVSTMRTWDNFFWWTEVRQFPPHGVVEPVNWNPKAGMKPVNVSGAIKKNHVFVTSGTEKVTVWLSPELVDFEHPVQVTLNGHQLSLKDRMLEPNAEVILEDVRTRGERLHPFWVKIE